MKKVFLTTLLSSMLLLGCDTLSEIEDDSALEDGSTIPNKPNNPELTNEEKIESNAVATFFRNAITAETLHRGIIDRALQLEEEMLEDGSCTDKTSANNGTYTLNSECVINYDVGNAYKGISGSFTDSGDSNSNEGLSSQFNDLVLEIDGAKFKINGTINIKDIPDGETHTSNDLTITSLDTGRKFVFNQFALTTLEYSTHEEHNAKGQLTVLESDGTELYAVNYKTDLDWQRYTNNVYPTLGKLTVSYTNDAARYITLTATTNPDNAIYYAQDHDYVIANNTSTAWNSIIVNPSEYTLP